MRYFLLFVLPLLFTFAPSLPTPHYHRILFAGNSITRNPPAPGEPYHWDGYWGERASAAHKDYVHQVWAGVAAHQGSVPDMEFARVIYLEDALAVGDAIMAYEPDLLIVQWGEAAPYELPQEDWDTVYAKIKDAAGGATVVAVGMWGTHEIRDKEDKLRVAALNAGMLYVPFADIHNRRSPDACAGLPAGRKGVCNHPDDSEMSAIAERILATLYAQSTYLPLVHSEGGGTVPP